MSWTCIDERPLALSQCECQLYAGGRANPNPVLGRKNPMTDSLAPLSIPNFREMGSLPAQGGSVRPGTLYRSGHLAAATPSDLDHLVELGIGRIVDFRTDYDHEGDGGPDLVPDGVSHLRLPLPDVSGRHADMRAMLTNGRAAEYNEQFGGGIALELATNGVATMATHPVHRAVFGDFIRYVAAQPEAPILWHCSAGKDRAGWAATLLGITLGVPDDVLIEHYLESNAGGRLQGRLEHWLSTGIDVDAIRPLIFVQADYIQAGLEAIDAGWASRDDYLRDGLDVSDAQLATLRKHFIT